MWHYSLVILFACLSYIQVQQTLLTRGYVQLGFDFTREYKCELFVCRLKSDYTRSAKYTVVAQEKHYCAKGKDGQI